MIYTKLQGYDLKLLKELVERNGWKNVQLSLDDIKTDQSSKCPYCKGKGTIKTDWVGLVVCTTCNGTGTV